ncbi:MAG: aminotransferase class V-fold PLP-dependent enzyme [Chryseobacterium sp.]|nr:MAG: aminotransferase class V-fold PLP-dependent enzyme [Chryseobacterium sp.]
MNQIAYLDNAATTQVDTKVLETMIPYLSDFYGNPSAKYALGRVRARGHSNIL